MTDDETPDDGGLSPSHADLLFAMLFKDRSEDPAEAEAGALPEPWRGLACLLHAVPRDDRWAAWREAGEGLSADQKCDLYLALGRVPWIQPGWPMIAVNGAPDGCPDPVEARRRMVPPPRPRPLDAAATR